MTNKDIDRWIVSKYAFVTWDEGRIEIASLISDTVFRTENPDVLHVLNAFSQARAAEDIASHVKGYTDEELATCIDKLVESGILVSASADDPITENHWERNALAFHRKSRHLNLQSVTSHEMAAIVGPRSTRTIALARPSAGKGRYFADVLESRRSRRAWPKRTISCQVFSSLLWMSVRNRDSTIGELRGGHASRPYPSGGAVYSLEVYLVIAPGSVDLIEAGIYKYLPDLHRLAVVCEEAAICLPFLEAAGRSAGSNPPPVVLLITSRVAQQSEAYGDLAYSLILKEVGGLFQTLYLVAEYLDLGACALGGGTPDEMLTRLCGTTEFVEPVVGEFMVGPR